MNPQQREGIVSVDGAVLLLAGAGSGKTRVITHRIAYLIQERGVNPDSILAVTFTNKAAKEMQERVEKILGHSTLAKPTLATFHSFCVRVLRRDIEALRVGNVGLTRSFAIYDENDQQAVVKMALKRLGIDDKSLKPRVVLGRISWAKNHMIDPQEYFLASSNPMEEKIAHIFEIYRKELAKNNALDFDDLLLETVRLLKSSAEVRERYNRKYRYLLIDEYQDTNRPQYELMKLLGKHGNVCVVGDEDQSIYSWRGADIKNILDFEKDFSDAKTIRLEQNYRSTQVILEGASAVVAQNTQRKGKNLFTEREGGSLIGYYEAPDGENEALFIADRIAKYFRDVTAGTEQPSETPRCAVLYRTNSQSRLIEEALRRYQIKYHMVGGFSFYERAEVKDMLCYLKLVQNPHDSIAFQRVVNSPPRGIGKTTMDTLERIALTSGKSTWDAIKVANADKLLPARALTALVNFKRLIDDARAMMGPDFLGALTASAEGHEGASDELRVSNSGFDPQLGADNSQLDPDSFVPEADDASTNFDFGFGFEAPDAPAPASVTANDANSDFDTSFNFGFDFGPSEEISTIAPENSGAPGPDSRTRESAATTFNPFAPKKLSPKEEADERAKNKAKLAAIVAAQGGAHEDANVEDARAFRAPGDPATLPELIKFLNDRSGYIRALEDEATPEAISRIENLKELANAAQDATSRGETLAEFLDHAALVSDADQYSAEARVTLMTLHAAKGLEFPLVFLCGMEEGLFPHSRTLQDPTQMEEERRLCYVGMTRAMDTLLITRARYRRRYGNDMPESSMPSRFLEEIPSRLVEDLSPRSYGFAHGDAYATPYPQRGGRKGGDDYSNDSGYSYEDESQEPGASRQAQGYASQRFGGAGRASGGDRTAGFFGKGGGSSSDSSTGYKPGGQRFPARPKLDIPNPTGKTGIGKGVRVRHPKYGEGIIFAREGDGDDAKVTVQFNSHGVKKLVEKFAQLERL
ncbi:DNA helicase-2 / ATP-dependent DNA helicase PcrA [Bryocella elongata]|uniref:DNA 3'-5' helicase n=1 Tax=Bryocella elongata TaxID=863522 RepID=A0A1H6BI99_9BACT|nr:UvrD-helicase domain-containing protein [Bryocella elongata]SEG59936.1 DNA helicase-2 / ATP-dependent DNA helicase PcrA [Bryocella elongata]